LNKLGRLSCERALDGRRESFVASRHPSKRRQREHTEQDLAPAIASALPSAGDAQLLARSRGPECADESSVCGNSSSPGRSSTFSARGSQACTVARPG